MKVISEEETKSTEEITCPYCGDTEPYSYEYCRGGSEVILCSTCENNYTAMTDHPITYTTKRLSNEIT